jgi:NAD(P)H-hydrate epimerase
VLAGWDIPLESGDRLFDLPPASGVLLDGILGTGLKGPPREPAARFIHRLNELSLPVVAVDGPSGADLDSGLVLGACVEADLTVSFGWPKLGLLRFPAREYAGVIETVEIGFPPPETEFGARAITGRWVQNVLPRRRSNSHKGNAGYVTIVAGQEGMAGAAILAVRAAMRGGAGIVRSVSDPANRVLLQSSVPGAVCSSWDDAASVIEAIEWSHALAVGPGLGRGAGRRDLVSRILEERGGRPVVLDADGLSSWEGAGDALAERLRPFDVITPHPGELSRLLGTDPAAIVADAPQWARAAAERFGCTIVLKGAPTLVAGADGPLRVATTGGAALAAGGTGDVLSGLLAALLAAGAVGPDAAMSALFISGLASEVGDNPAGHGAADIPDRVPAIRRAIELLPESVDGPVIFAGAHPARPGGGPNL